VAIEKSTISAHPISMSKEELKQFLEAMVQLRQTHAFTAAAARRFLQEEGFLTEQGDVAQPYSDDRPAKSQFGVQPKNAYPDLRSRPQMHPGRLSSPGRSAKSVRAGRVG
jgi:hypothetical protein